MEVHDPQIDSMNKTVQSLSKWIQANFNEIINPLQSLKKLPDMLTNFQKSMVEQFKLLFINQIEAEAVSRQANIKANEHNTKVIDNHLTKKEKQLAEAKGRIQERYERIAKKNEEQHGKYLKNLDSHVFEITDNLYPAQIEEKFSLSHHMRQIPTIFARVFGE